MNHPRGGKKFWLKISKSSIQAVRADVGEGKIMLRNRVLVKIFALWIVTGAPLFGQTEPTPSGAGHDYFTAEQDGVKGIPGEYDN